MPKFEEAGCEIFGISFDTPEENKHFAECESFPYKLLSDADRKIGEAQETKREEGHDYVAFPRRFAYLINPEGKVAKNYVVKDVSAHADEVLRDLEELKSS